MNCSSAARLVLAIVSIGVSPSARAEDWPHWLGPRGDGISREEIPADASALDPAWTVEVGIGFSSVAVAEGRVYTMGHRDGRETIWCLSESDGAIVWRYDYGAELMPNLHEGGPGATPTVQDGMVYTLGKDGAFHALDAGAGKVVWRKDMHELSGLYRPPEWGYTASPVIVGDRVLVEAGATFAFDRKTGDRIWRSEDFRPAYGTIQAFRVDGSNRLAVLKTDGLVVLDPDDGATLAFEMWRTSFRTNSTTPLDAGSGRLFISTGYDRGCALFRFDGERISKVYENQNMCNHMGNSVLLGGFLYGFDGTAHRGRPVEFTCIELESGEKRWHTEAYRYGSVTAAGNDLVVLTETGRLLVGTASPEGFSPRIERRILEGRCWTPPVWANGRVFARNAAGRLVAIPLQ